MSLPGPASGPAPALATLPNQIEIVEPDPIDCSNGALPPEGNVIIRNYRLHTENVRAYTPTADTHTSSSKSKLVSKYTVSGTVSTPQSRILELLRPDDPGREAIEAIVHPTPRRGLALPLDDDTRRFLQRSLPTSSARALSNVTPEPGLQHQQGVQKELEASINKSCRVSKSGKLRREMSLADEMREAEEDCFSETINSNELLWEYRKRGLNAAQERERLGKLALTVEDDTGERDEEGLGAAARRLDALLSASRDLHHELAGIHEDMQIQCCRAARCTEDARALGAESRALQFLDDLVALLRGDVDAAATATARSWPFVLGSRHPDRNYIV